MEKDLSILTERQKTAYLLREQGLSYRKMAEQMGNTAPAARQHVLAALKRLRECEAYHQEQAENERSVVFPLTRGELDVIISGLGLLERKMLSAAGGANIRRDFLASLPYEAQIVGCLYERAQAALYGYVAYGSRVIPHK